MEICEEIENTMGKDCDIPDEASESKDEVGVMNPVKSRKGFKLAKLRAPSFEGYFASGSKSFAINKGGEKLTATIENKIGEIQAHLEQIINLLRDIDMLRMAVRVESRFPQKKRYLTVVASDAHSAILGIDWLNENSPTIGLVLPIWNSTVSKLDGDGGLHVSRTISRNHMFKPVSVQTLWSAKQVIDKAIDYATKHRYFEGMGTIGFLEYYEGLISSDTLCMAEWNEMDDLFGSPTIESIKNNDVNGKVDTVKELIRGQLREIMRKVDLDEITCKEVREKCEQNLGLNLKDYKQFINEEMLVVMGQMDSASKILDYLYLGSEWNATGLVDLKELGIGYILNITREVDNFFPQTFVYYNIRVLDAEDTELLKHWDHTYRFIEKAREQGSKVLVHCRYGISRSASTVIAYIMKKKGWGMKETLEYVKGIRSIVEPNQGFQKQLIIYEGILNSSRNRFSKLFDNGPSEKKETTEQKKIAIDKRKDFLQKRLSQKDMKNSMEDVGNAESINKPATEANSENADIIDEQLQAAHVADSSDGKELRNRQQGKKRVCVKTMVSGAVLIDEGDRDDDGRCECGESDHESDNDPVEDALMEKVVHATQMKNQLMRSVKELQTEPVYRDNGNVPSVLRRFSLAPAL